MKVRKGFITNSSSSIFIIKNRTEKELTICEFVEDNLDLLDDFLKEYGSYKDDNKKFNYDRMREDAKNRLEKARDLIEECKKEGRSLDELDEIEKEYVNNAIFPAGEKVEVEYGDDDGDVLGAIFDYMLRDSGASKSFEWYFKEFNR